MMSWVKFNRKLVSFSLWSKKQAQIWAPTSWLKHHSAVCFPIAVD